MANINCILSIKYKGNVVINKAIAVFVITFLNTILCTSAMAQQPQQSLKAADWLVTCANKIQWKAFKDSSYFLIGFFGSPTQDFTDLNILASQGAKVKSKPIKIINLKKIKDITPTDILYIDNRFEEELPKIHEICVANRTAVATYRAPETKKKYYFINIMLDNGKTYIINSKNVGESDAGLCEELLLEGGSNADLRDLYLKKERELQAKLNQLYEQGAKLEEKKKELERQKSENIKINEQYKALETELQQTEEEINTQKTKAALLMAEVRRQQRKLAENQLKLGEQEQEIQNKQNQIEKANKDIKEKEQELSDRENKISQQETALAQQDTRISQQQYIIIGTAIFVALVIVLIIFIWRSLRARKRANLALKKKNIELNRQKDEINQQALQLEESNKELEKLSIVAGKTQNAIVIMDRNGYFEWVNAGFTRLYGYTLQLLRNERDENIVNVNSNKSIRNILYKCVSNKQTIVFESYNATRYGQKIWCQTTMTPILNPKGEVSQLVAIYTDISKLKEQEVAIRNQNEELLQQKNTLEAQKDQIEAQHRSIRAGILYAQTIQRTILPPKSLIDKYFDCFILYKPKDIVSGDFYWFAETEEEGRQYKFIGAMDCTGHGVPGAFMSLIGNRLLNEIVIVKRNYSPCEIMDQLNQNVVKALKQDQSTNKDGMDTCFCRIENHDDGSYTVTFCGAKRPLYFFKDNEEEIQSLKGDRKSIGGVQKKRSQVEFTNQELILHSGDILYLSSDGIIDQNNKERVRFGTDNFLAMLTKIHKMPMEQQGSMIEQRLEEYKEGEEQRDDISVLGIKLR